jgi:outer membrane protein OmpA-like peptidoglycan-associated protein
MSSAFRLGVFVVITLLILGTGIFLIGDKQFLFSPTYRLEAQFHSVDGLNEGADVRVGGIREGTIKHIHLPDRPEDNVTVEMKMDNSTREIIRKDSVASIKTEGLLGNKFIEITFGSKEAGKVENGDTIRSVSPVDMTEVANSIAAEAKAGLTSFQENMEALKQNFLLRGFFTKRGYEDTSDLTRHAISKLPAKTPIKTFVYDAADLFDKQDSAKLKNAKTLNETGEFLQGNKFGLAVVVASSEMTGDSDKDRVLTQARAVVVRNYLINNFKLDDTRIKSLGLGKSRLPGDNSKVQIFIYDGNPTIASAQGQAPHSP